MPPTRPARPSSASTAKADGNAAFASRSHLEARRAVWHYTDALLLLDAAQPAESGQTCETWAHEAAVLRSNRSASHARLGQWRAALEDAEAAIALRPDWAKVLTPPLPRPHRCLTPTATPTVTLPPP